MSRPLVRAPAGTIVGTSVGDSVSRFLGIPYAQAPHGDARFRAPVRHPRFDDTFEADSYGPTPQRIPLFASTTVPEPSIDGDDILNLNVFAPREGNGLPVMVWIHGGGYVAGSAASPWYDGSAFARDGVILVSVSYRLGLDGFAFLDSTPTNLGLRDLICALEWVQDNISAFGGDPDRVTIAGQSAGGGAVLALLASPLAVGLFSAAFSESGVIRTMTTDEAAASTAAVADLLGVACTRDVLLTVSDTAAQQAVRRLGELTETALVLGPICGDEVLPDDIVTGVSLRSPVPLLIGSTADEFDGGPTLEDPARPHLDADTRAAARASGTRITDSLFRAPCPQVARARSGSAPTWAYSFEWVSPVTDGSTHCIDIPFFFDNLDQPGVPEAMGPTPPSELAQLMHRDVVEFVRNHALSWATTDGNPGDVARCYGGEEGAVANGSDVVDVPGAYDAVIMSTRTSATTQL